MKRALRRIKKTVRVGGVIIGGEHPIAVQSMTKTRTSDVKKTLAQIDRLRRAGCEIVRVAVVNKTDAGCLAAIKAASPLPVVADIHFDYRLALAAIDAGVDKIRINPGNIGESHKLTAIIKKAQDRSVPIRIGVNAGSLPAKIRAKYPHPDAAALVEALEDALAVFEKNKFRDIVVSAKGSDVRATVDAYAAVDGRFDYPLHLGITEAGLLLRGAVRSAVGIGILLARGIGDTIRVSLTADPVFEVVAAYEILNALNLRRTGPVLISCPTCGRCEVDLIRIAKAVEKKLARRREYMKVAVMGCVVNGPGEAREADFGIACGKSVGAVFKHGREVMRVKESRLIGSLMEVIDEDFDNR